ncbi:DUF4129 domain-containing protein [Curtobacterium sp. ISL-83]|uniref:DUF4129 domain-containing protein n=1 Tax=Curtobacterium sp. ISL-83 TaxID=2819145 RepID=UPI001BE6ACA3|nr:DUF4129 domain-containing protein [Curtobacterium sp. ISL-83]MBT2503111.1 DUF4129 domain-containing protein [Curtobacterium sp. ISL-83]
MALTAVSPDEARRLLEHELQRSEYAGAHVTWWDRASQGFFDWLSSIRLDGLGSPAVGNTLLWIAGIVLVAVVVLVVVARGLPRRRARSAASDDRGVFDPDDLRSARDLGVAAAAAYRAGDWDGAVLDGFRALARGLGERDLVPDLPGATARAIADRASRPFPTAAGRLEHAAATFDAVRYLGSPADQTAASRVLETERAIRAARPARADEPAVPA